jgi:hypothetical protein
MEQPQRLLLNFAFKFDQLNQLMLLEITPQLIDPVAACIAYGFTDLDNGYFPMAGPVSDIISLINAFKLSFFCMFHNKLIKRFHAWI